MSANKFIKAWESMKKTGKGISDKLTGPIKDRMDDELGIYIHKYIATLFFFDKKTQEYMHEVRALTRAGKKEEALKKSTQMKAHVLWMVKHDRKAQKQLKKINKALKFKTDEIKEKFSKLGDYKFIKWLKGEEDGNIKSDT